MTLLLLHREDGAMKGVPLATIEQVAAYVADHALVESLWEDIAGSRLRVILEQHEQIQRVTAEYNEVAALLGLAVKEAIGGKAFPARD